MKQHTSMQLYSWLFLELLLSNHSIPKEACPLRASFEHDDVFRASMKTHGFADSDGHHAVTITHAAGIT